ncbi:MAG: hypothetical protein Kow0058_16110 [Roseovarius sp.]
MTRPESAPRIASARPEMTARLMAGTGLDEAILRALVHRFYDRVRADDALGPIFEERIADWGPHLERMVDFWSSVALMTGRYHGAPIPAHATLPVSGAHFERWLALFRESAREICPQPGAARVIAAAERIARALHMAVRNAQAVPDAIPDPPIQIQESAMSEAPLDDPAELTRHIETRYHARHREQLPRLAELAEKVETVHFGDEDLPEGLGELLRRMIGEMEVHMKKEELILFPAIRRGGMPGIENPIAVMRADHAGHEREIAEIRRLTANLTLPKSACRSWSALYDGLAEFVADLEAHMRLENEVLFPPFEQAARHG